MTKIKICTLAGVLGGMVARAFGGWSSDMTTLVVFMSIDFIMGLIVAGVFGKSDKSPTGALDSKAGWRGLSKKCVTLLFILIAHRLDVALSLNYIKSATVIAFILNETISMTENAGLMGIPIPTPVAKGIELLKNKEDRK